MTSPADAPATDRAALATPVFDNRYIAYVFNQRGYHVNEFAARLDLSNSVVEAFLRGTVEPGDLRIATLTSMANMLGIPLHSMFTRPAATDVDLTPQNDSDDPLGSNAVDTDAAQLIATVYDTGRATPTLITDIASAFDWTTERVFAAAAEGTRRLEPAGLRIATSHGELFITPIEDHHKAHRALTNRKTYERGLSYTHYKAVHQVLGNHQVTVNRSGRQRLRTLGGLVNLGVINQAKNPALTEAALEAFL